MNCPVDHFIPEDKCWVCVEVEKEKKIMALLDSMEGFLSGLQKIADAADKIPGAERLQRYAWALQCDIEDQLKAIAKAEERP